MTREEREKAIDLLDNLLGMVEDNQDNDYDKALKMGIESLRKEPCADAISRKAVLDMATTIQTDDYSGNEIMEVVDIDDIKDLPSVTPTRKKGKWICVHHIENKITYDSWKCSECQHDFESEEESMVDFDEYKYCPNCGAEMEGEDGNNKGYEFFRLKKTLFGFTR